MISISYKYPDWDRKLKKASQEINLFIAAVMQTNRGMLFDSEGSNNGHDPWKPLAFREGMILSNRGVLRKSIAPMTGTGQPGPSGIVRFNGDVVTIGTKVAYARMMNDGTTKLPGGVIRAKKAKALKIPVPQGDKANANAKALQVEANNKKIATLQARLNATRSESPARAKLITQISLLREKNRKGIGPVKFIFRKSVRIPARPFDTWTRDDEKELESALTGKIREILNG